MFSINAPPQKRLEEVIRRDNEEALKLVAALSEAKALAARQREERAALVKFVTEESSKAAKSQERGKWFWVPSDWWERVALGEDPGPLDFSKVLCKHGTHVNPRAKSSLKCLPEACWARILDIAPGASMLETTDVCEECFVEFCKGALLFLLPFLRF